MEAGTLSSRERVLTALRHREFDRVPFDLGGTHVTGIASRAYQRLRAHLELPPRDPYWADVIQQIVVPDEDLLERLQVDTRGLFPLCSHNWNVHEQLQDEAANWIYRDEWGITHTFPKENGLWFTVVSEPLRDAQAECAVVDRHPWPDARDGRRLEGLRALAEKYRGEGKIVILKGLCAGLFEMSQRIRGMQNALTDPLMYPDVADRLYGTLADLKTAFFETALQKLGDVVDIVVETDDYGTQQSQIISPEQYRATLKTHQTRLFSAIKQAAPNAFLFFHSCGNVRPLLPDFIEAGVDILNPVHVRAAGMEPRALKKDFGDAITFWGGGVDTQHTLPRGTPQAVKDDVKRNLDALAPGGGYVFSPVHNIQSDVPPENVVAMWEALQEYGVY